MWKRRTPILYAVGLAGAATLGVGACEPGGGDLNTSAVALTVDEMGTKALERQRLDVAWISCTARYADRVTPKSGSPTRAAVVEVDCQGESDGGQDITIKGKVHAVVDGRCVRGNLTAKVDGKEWFQVDVLGNCGADDGNGDGKPSPPPASQPPPSHDEPEPGPTTTVTVTVTPPPPSTCDCAPGK
ncbi:hypothetical protein DMA15_11730 [Streptomyces sp. WAC 01529]|uniref:hypothetical protein n=1 Tax=Streptomyces sp. WAC 01529 TaxID=2203205 RepID=UPI000F6B9CBE|nr:hypothetical protein [Streptomyces sp. WAC 01529]AZM53181.1 hypothetical protein DMA15_11730 [Streptomyces sp. WAC 01529]